MGMNLQRRRREKPKFSLKQKVRVTYGLFAGRQGTIRVIEKKRGAWWYSVKYNHLPIPDWYLENQLVGWRKRSR